MDVTKDLDPDYKLTMLTMADEDAAGYDAHVGWHIYETAENTAELRKLVDAVHSIPVYYLGIDKRDGKVFINTGHRLPGKERLAIVEVLNAELASALRGVLLRKRSREELEKMQAEWDALRPHHFAPTSVRPELRVAV